MDAGKHDGIIALAENLGNYCENIPKVAPAETPKQPKNALAKTRNSQRPKEIKSDKVLWETKGVKKRRISSRKITKYYD